ncbi:MAG: hypothetical protein NVS3B21_26100 [Acidimicrobiales bacterium]
MRTLDHAQAATCLESLGHSRGSLILYVLAGAWENRLTRARSSRIQLTITGRCIEE